MISIDTSCIDAYLKRILPDQDAWYYKQIGGYHPVSDQRQEVCDYLCKELMQYESFPVWNRELTRFLFQDVAEMLQGLTIMPIIGSAPYLDAGIISHHEKPVLWIDLLHIADYTQRVKEMCYILHNLCHMHLLRYMMGKCFSMPSDYHKLLAYRFFTEGFVLYLSWNEDHSRYVFDAPAYAKRKQRAFAMMEAAQHIEEADLQKQILHTLTNGDLWDRFPDVAGMFFCAALYQEDGIHGLADYFAQGWEVMIQE